MIMKRKSKAKPPAAPWDPNAIHVFAPSEEDRAAVLAHTLLRPTLQGAATVKAYKSYADGDGVNGVELNALIAELQAQVAAASGGNLQRVEEMLIAQAHSLDAIFGNLARRAVAQQHLANFELFLRLALKSQSQCRTTLETLALIKNPPNVAFVRQANIAHGPQQVNNAAAPGGDGSRARETENLQNKLLEAQHGERLDTGTAGTASTADSPLATVGAVNGAKDGKG